LRILKANKETKELALCNFGNGFAIWGEKRPSKRLFFGVNGKGVKLNQCQVLRFVLVYVVKLAASAVELCVGYTVCGHIIVINKL
jgi:hypothetical protein